MVADPSVVAAFPAWLPTADHRFAIIASRNSQAVPLASVEMSPVTVNRSAPSNKLGRSTLAKCEDAVQSPVSSSFFSTGRVPLRHASHQNGGTRIIVSASCWFRWLTRGRNWLSAAVFVWMAFCVVDLLSISAYGEQPLKGVDLSGQLRRFGERADTNVVVVCFLSTQCPISNGYLPLLNDLFSKYREGGVEVYGVISSSSVTRSAALEHSKTYGVRFPVLFDGSGELRWALQPTHTPQALVLTASGEKLYSGAIDDRHIKLGQKKDVATEAFLENAVKAAIKGKAIAKPVTRPIGCLMEDPPNKTESGSVTFTRDIAPIIQANCATCHRPGQSAPFSLLSYDDVSSHANQILEVTQSRFMPPWKPAKGFTRFLDELRLTENELSLLSTWVKDGKPHGDPDDLPDALEFPKGWQLGEPDLVLEMKDVFRIPASGPDIRRYFVLPTRLTENRLITAIEFQPGAPQAVHHAGFFIDTTGEGRRLDQADSGPGYGGYGGPRVRSQGTLTSWLPGMTPRRLPIGLGRLIPRASDIVAEIHYVTTGKPEQDRSKIGLHFASRSATQMVAEVQVGNKEISIPGGKQRHHERASYTLPVHTTLLDVVPHMHTLGREMKVWTKTPGGTTKPLLWINDWDFNWQGQYSFAKPVRLPKGTQIIVDAWFDNSADNPLNPNSPPVTVGWGDNSTDEMLLCHFQCTCKTVDQLRELIMHQEKYIAVAGTLRQALDKEKLQRSAK